MSLAAQVAGVVVIPYVLVATDAARRVRVLRVAGEDAQKRNHTFWREDRRCIILAISLAVATAVCLAACAIERGAYRMKQANFKQSIKRTWASCEEEASPDGTWRERNDCPWDNKVRVYYPRPQKLAKQRLTNLKHIVFFASMESVLLLLAALCLLVAYTATTNGSSAFSTDALRRRPRLIERN